jgi:tripartite-type tricarboxylate transporter receptor subunit TctC
MKSLATLSRRAAALFALGLLAGSAIAAEPYPSRPVKLMVPYPAGGLSDAIARVFSQPLSKQLGQPVVVENLAGVGGALAAQRVLDTPADGYYVFLGTPNELILAPMANAAVKLKSEEFRFVQMVGTLPMMILARKDLPANTADELVALARNAPKSNPLTFGSVGYGSFYHLMGDHMAQTIGAPMTHVPYKGGAPLLMDLSGSLLDFVIFPVSQQQLAMAQQGHIKIIAGLDAKRSQLPALKNIPSVDEGKALKGFNFSFWTGYFVRKDTPEEVVQRIGKALNAVLSDANVRNTLEAQNVVPSQSQSFDELSKIYQTEITRFRTIAKSIKLQPQ